MGKSIPTMGGTKMLWTNQSPGASFGAQTVALDLTGYDAVLVVLKNSTTTDTYASMVCVKEIQSNIVCQKESDSGVVASRGVLPSDTGVQFLSGRITNAFAGTRRADNSYGIPYQIYGIKW